MYVCIYRQCVCACERVCVCVCVCARAHVCACIICVNHVWHDILSHAHLLQLAVFLEEIGKLRFDVFAVPLLL